MENPQLIDKEVEAFCHSSSAQNLQALKRLHEYDSSFEAGKGFPLNHASSKVRPIIMYFDLVDSTNLGSSLPVDKLVTMIRAFIMK
jgi:hypothetical protein